MTLRSESPADRILISWISVGAGAAPLLTAIKDRGKVLGGAVKTLYLCYRDAEGADGDRERVVLKETQKALKNELAPHCPTITLKPWKTVAPPTDHDEIRRFAERVLQEIRRRHPKETLVIHLSPGTPAMHAVWLTLGSTGFVSPPVMLIQTNRQEQGRQDTAVQVVDFTINSMLRHYVRARPDVAQDVDDGTVWDPLAVKSPALQSALKKLEKWAPLRAPVLLLGERGTGKTTLANYLRSISPFQKSAGGAWPAVVCGQFRVNPQLARSELFGHVKGAFTGADKAHTGLLKKADGETVFFDEIADIDQDTQRLLIGALEGGGFQPLGGTERVQSSFRIVCATNRSLDDLRTNCLDRDFFDRLAVFVLSVPPLRECVEDIPHAWAKVLRRATVTASVQPEGWHRFLEHQDILGPLTQHPLPGNFRDLQRVAFHLLAELQAGCEDVAAIEVALACLRDADSLESLEPRVPCDLDEELRKLQQRLIKTALEQADGNVSEAARLLSMRRETLKNRIKKDPLS